MHKLNNPIEHIPINIPFPTILSHIKYILLVYYEESTHTITAKLRPIQGTNPTILQVA